MGYELRRTTGEIQLNVRIDKPLHKKLNLFCTEHKCSKVSVVEVALDRFFKEGE